ncbi:hypothetical protein ACOME3_010161 [Neoechinorhynchus agilis]
MYGKDFMIVFCFLLIVDVINASLNNHGNVLVAHYSRELRVKEVGRVRRQAQHGHWQEPPQRSQIEQQQPSYWAEQQHLGRYSDRLDIYIFAPGKHTTKMVGDSVHFDCELSDGFSGTWSRESGVPFSPSTETKKLLHRNIYRIDMENLQSSDSGTYICRANTGNPRDFESVFLEVTNDPHRQYMVPVPAQQQPPQPPPSVHEQYPYQPQVSQEQAEYGQHRDTPYAQPEQPYPDEAERARLEQERENEMYLRRLEDQRREMQRLEEEQRRLEYEQQSQQQQQEPSLHTPDEQEQYWEEYKRQQQLYGRDQEDAGEETLEEGDTHDEDRGDQLDASQLEDDEYQRHHQDQQDVRANELPDSYQSDSPSHEGRLREQSGEDEEGSLFHPYTYPVDELQTTEYIAEDDGSGGNEPNEGNAEDEEAEEDAEPINGYSDYAYDYNRH